MATRLRKKLHQGHSPEKEDIELFLSLLRAFSPDDLDKLGWKTWSRVHSFQSMDLKTEPTFDPDRISQWLQEIGGPRSVLEHP